MKIFSALFLTLFALCARADALFVGSDEGSDVRRYAVYGEDGKVCMTLDFNANFSVPYSYVNESGVNVTVEQVIELPYAAHSDVNSSVCPSKAEGSTGIFNITFGSNGTMAVFIDMLVNGKRGEWRVVTFGLQVDYRDQEYFPFASSEFEQVVTFTNNDADIVSSNSHGYKCGKQMDLVLESDIASFLNATMVYDMLVLNPFNTGELTTCGSGKHHANKIVPIAVGAALAALLLMVLVAYIINRASSKRRGYEKV